MSRDESTPDGSGAARVAHERQKAEAEPRTGFSRRRLLKWAGIGAGTLAIGALGAGGVRAATNGVWQAGTLDAHELWSTWRTETGIRGVAAAGALAASPHNTQPWHFDLAANRIDLHAVAERRIPITDASLREHYAGLGCALENMVRAAPGLGFVPAVSLFPQGAESSLVARVQLVPSRGEPDPLDVEIDRRHTNRGPYAATPVPANTLQALTRVAEAHRGIELVWLTSAAQRDEMSALLVEATKALIADEEQSVDSASWFRTSSRDVDTHRDGITLDAQTLDAFTLAAAKILPPQSREAADRFWVDRAREEQCPTAAAYGILAVPDVADHHAQVLGGRALQAVHLAATAEGLGLHPMNQITERIDRNRALGEADQFSSRFGALLGRPAETLLLAFRIGYPERAALPSPRRTLDAVTTETMQRP